MMSKHRLVAPFLHELKGLRVLCVDDPDKDKSILRQGLDGKLLDSCIIQLVVSEGDLKKQEKERRSEGNAGNWRWANEDILLWWVYWWPIAMVGQA